MNMAKNLLLWAVIAVILMSVFSNFGTHHPTAEKITYSQFLHAVDKSEVAQVTIDQRKIIGTFRDSV